MDLTARQSYWRRNIRLKACLLVVWFVVSYGFGILLVEQLNTFSLGDFELGFWFAQQGSIFTFVVLIGIYAWRMDTLDRDLRTAEGNGNGRGEGADWAGAAGLDATADVSAGGAGEAG